MLDAFYVSAVGMQAQKRQLDSVSSNLSNANTAGYKRERVDFGALLDRHLQPTAAPDTAGAQRPLAVTTRDLRQGELRATESPLDIAINGAGLIEVALPGGRMGYVRGGGLQVNQDGYLASPSGHVLAADIRVPASATNLRINQQGVVTVALPGSNDRVQLGQIQLVQFMSPEQLQYAGGGLFVAQEGAEPAVKAYPEEEGMGSIEAGRLEMSNVQLVDEMVALMMAQRVYELNAKVVQASDELMSMTNNLRRG